jgi:hypothetical protein
MSRFNCGFRDEMKKGDCTLKTVVHKEEGMLEDKAEFV